MTGELLATFGFALIVTGLFFIWWPLAIIFAGIVCVAVGLWVDFEERTTRE